MAAFPARSTTWSSLREIFSVTCNRKTEERTRLYREYPRKLAPVSNCWVIWAVWSVGCSLNRSARRKMDTSLQVLPDDVSVYCWQASRTKYQSNFTEWKEYRLITLVGRLFLQIVSPDKWLLVSRALYNYSLSLLLALFRFIIPFPYYFLTKPKTQDKTIVNNG